MPTEDRNFRERPYSADEARVAKYLSDLGVGGGDDPVGFILLSNTELARRNRIFRDRLSSAGMSVSFDEDPDASEEPSP